MKENIIELWSSVIDFEGQYEISNCGQFKYVPKTIKRFRKDTQKEYVVNINGKASYGSISKKGYLIVKLWKDKKSKSIPVHRLVAQAFIPNPLNLPQVNHIDGNKQNNHVSNLEWCDNSHNIKHAYKNGLINRKGENQNTCKIKESDVIELREFYKNNPKALLSIYSVKLNLTKTSISRIINRKSWTHI